MRVCYFGTYEREYPRNSLMIAGLQEAGVEVLECHEPVWERRRDKSEAYRGRAALGMLLRLLWAYLRLIVRYLWMPTHDVVVVGYVGQFDMPLAWLLARLRAIPLVFNPLVSLYDTFCGDRALVRPVSLRGWLFWLLDYLACHAADKIVLDTAPQVAYFARTFHLPREKFCVVPVGADDRLFEAQPLPHRDGDQACEVLFVGKFMPLHGLETILRAAARLREQPLHFTLVGSGQEQALVRRMITDLDLSNVTLIDWIAYPRLPAYYARADICLGIFGDSDKAARVIPNKVFQALAMGRPVLTEDSPALRSEFLPGEEVWTCQPADAEDLARQILRLAGDARLRERLAQTGQRALYQRYGVRAIGARMLSCLSALFPGLQPEDRMVWGTQPEFYGPRHRFRENYLARAIRRYTPGPKVLDVACGAGSMTRRLVKDGGEVWGLDLSAQFLHYIRQKDPASQVTLLQGDATQLPLSSGQLDGVVAGELLEHLEEDTEALREFYRVLRPGGICVLSVPAGPEQWDWHDDWAGHLRRYRREQLRQLLVGAGFTVLRLHYFGFPFVRIFHRHVYLPRYRRKVRAHSNDLAQLTANGRWQRLLGNLLLGIFQMDNLFNILPWGIGLIAVGRKSESNVFNTEM